jgi:hypothetical protein
MAADNYPRTSLATIVDELRQLRTRRVTGTYYVISDDNRQARINLLGGEIATILLRGAEGMSALEGLVTMQIIRTRFSADGMQPAVGRGGLLNTDDIYNELLRHAGIAVAPRSNTPSRGPKVAALSAAQQQWIRQAFIHYMGPIANLVYEDHQHPDQTVDSMLIKLSAEIPDTRRAAEFLTLARQRLQQST